MCATSTLSALPAIDSLLRHPSLADCIAVFGTEIVTDLARREVDTQRTRIRGGGDVPAIDEIAAHVDRQVRSLMASNLTPVFNLTGTVIHTNLGRAPMADEAVAAMQRAAGAAALEFDLA